MKRLISLLLAFVFSFIIVIAPSASGSDDFPVSSTASATAFVLMDADTGEVLAGRNSDLPLPMASTTKIMTCIVALEEGILSDEVVIPKEAVGVEGSSIYLTKDEKLSLEELLYGLMLESANDAAVAIACHISGSVDAFVEKMNAKACAIGMNHSMFQNPHGLPTDSHYSTARDLSKLMKYSLQNEVFCEVISTKTKNISAPNEKTRYLSNHNKLLRLYEDCIGGKTGFTKAAGRCLVSAAERDGKTLICSTLGDPDDWRDHMSLYDYGFSQYSTRVLSEAGAYQFSVPVVGGEKSEIVIFNRDSFSLSLRDSEKIDCRFEVPKFVYAGVNAGDVIGSVVLLRDQKEIKRLPLFSQETVLSRKESLSFWEKIWQNIILWID